MRWRLLRRRLSISSPRMAVRSHLPWPLRWAVVAIALGFSGALALWAFEFGRGLAGLGQGARSAQAQVAELRAQLDGLRSDRDQARSIANSADSLLKAERVTQQKLADQVRALETENQALKADLGFFERLLPTSGEPIAIRGLQVEASATGPVRYQLLVMQQGVRGQADFRGTVEVFATGTRDASPWSTSGPMVRQSVQFRQYRRLEGLLQPPAGVVVRQIQIRVLDESGAVKATQVHRL